MGYIKLQPQETDTHKLIQELNKKVEDVTTEDIHVALKKTFKKQTPELRRKLIHAEIQNRAAALTLLRCYGLTIEDSAKIITTA